MKRLTILLLTMVLALPVLAGDDYEPDFSEKLDEGWSFVREDKADWPLREGALQLLAQPSNIWGKQNQKTENFLLRPMPGTVFVVEVTVDFTPKKQYEQAGILLYADDDNYIKFDREMVNGRQSCTLVLESKAQPRGVEMIPFREGPLRLRLQVSDGKVRAMVKAPDEKAWTPHGQTTLPGNVEKLRVGLFALNGEAGEPRWATFKDFSLTTDGIPD